MNNKTLLASAVAGLLLGSASLHAVSTTPVGYVTVNIAAGTGTTPVLSVISLPLLTAEDITGAEKGPISSVTANTITSANAGWGAGELSAAATPFLIKITSGAAEGRTFLISTGTANTATTVTIDAEDAAQTDLTTLGINAGDTYAIFACDTLKSAFENANVLGGATATGVDVVQLFVNGGWRKYYYRTTPLPARWVRVGFETESDTVPLRPDAGAMYSRIPATAMTLTCTGTVPDDARKSVVRNSGVTFLSSFWPVDLTLGTSNIHQTPGWVSNASATLADQIQMLVSGGWRKYYHDGFQWKRVGFETPSDNVQATVGSAVIVIKKGSATGSAVLTQNIPYSL